MKAILPDVFWLDGGSVNLYLCVDADGLTLIDTGMPRHEELVLTAVHQSGHQPADLKRIFITHADLDHAGSAAAIQAATGATVYAGQETAALLRDGRSPAHMPALIHWVLNTFMKYRPVPAMALHTFAVGDVLPALGGLEVLASPGHTPDHHSFYSPARGILFAGDALNTRNGRLQTTPPRITADQQAARQSALQLLERAPAIIACGHGIPQHTRPEELRPLINQLSVRT